MEPYYSSPDGRILLYHCRAEDLAADLPPGSVGLIATDPPFFKVKNAAWDQQWDTPAGFLAWLRSLCASWQRTLGPAGSLYCFASPAMAARVEVLIDEFFAVLNTIRWTKAEGWHKKASKEALRSYLSPWEAVIFAEQRGADAMARGEAGYSASPEFLFRPLRAWFLAAWKQSGLTRRAVDDACGTSNATQYWFLERDYQIPTAERYAVLQRLAPVAFDRSYASVRAEYEDLKSTYEATRRPFAASADVPHTDEWAFPTVAPYPGKHECEKPLAMFAHMIAISSRPDDLVADFFLGSGVAAEAAARAGRRFVGCDMSEHWIEQAAQRMDRWYAASNLHVPVARSPRRPVNIAPTFFEAFAEVV